MGPLQLTDPIFQAEAWGRGPTFVPQVEGTPDNIGQPFHWPFPAGEEGLEGKEPLEQAPAIQAGHEGTWLLRQNLVVQIASSPRYQLFDLGQATYLSVLHCLHL